MGGGDSSPVGERRRPNPIPSPYPNPPEIVDDRLEVDGRDHAGRRRNVDDFTAFFAASICGDLGVNPRRAPSVGSFQAYRRGAVRLRVVEGAKESVASSVRWLRPAAVRRPEAPVDSGRGAWVGDRGASSEIEGGEKIAMLENIGKWSIAYGSHLPHKYIVKYLEWRLLKHCLTTFRINCVLDVGANRGQFATNLRKIGYRGLIVSFEPIQQEYAALAHRFRKDTQWTGYHLALGDEDGSREFHIPLESTAMSSFLRPIENWNTTVHTVAIRRLDTLFPDIVARIPHPARIFLKMDTQGFDLEVVKGASRSMTAIVGLQSELSIHALYHGMPSYLESLAYYEQLGFSVYGLVDAARGERGDLVEMNCCMMRLESRQI